MCRISVLKFNKPGYNDVNLILPLLDVLAENGLSNKDGTGLSILDAERSLVLKTADEAKDFLWTENVLKFLVGWCGQDLFGHVRISTVSRGITKDENSHPYDVGDIIGMHNGHFNNYNQVRLNNNIQGAEVDSHVFYMRLAQIKGDNLLTPEIINQTLGEFTGNFALAMYDKKADKIFLVTGANDLNIYQLPYGWLVNTSPLVTSELNISLFKLSLVYQTMLKADGPTKLESYKIFELNDKGAVVLADASKGKEPEVIESTHYYGVGAKEKVYVNGPELLEIAIKEQEILNQFGFGIDGLSDFIDQMARFSPLHTFKFVTISDLNDALGFLNWIYPTVNIQEMEQKKALWDLFVETHKVAPYSTAIQQIPGFEIPFFLNSTADLEILVSERLPI